MDALLERIKYEEDAKTQKCGCTGCENMATHTWSGHPTCDKHGTPGRKQLPFPVLITPETSDRLGGPTMFCPETIKACNWAIYICHHGAGDVSWKHRPLVERLNPLRYEVAIWRKARGGYRFNINSNGRWRNIPFQIKKRLGAVR